MTAEVLELATSSAVYDRRYRESKMIEEWRDSKSFWIVLLGFLLFTRLPVMENYLSVDNVNLAFSLEKFDPRIHQPQPPGYPFFVALGKIVNIVFRDPERTFVVISILVSALCLP